MSSYISQDLKTQIQQIDRQRCCYCLTSEANSGISMTFDHIYPVSKGGITTFENLCLACRSCNEFKGILTEYLDSVTNKNYPLFNPRLQQWSEHFCWSLDGTKIEGLTSIGRATILALKMNNSVIVAARKRWVVAGWHPPND
jgi:hypothetical protein